MTDEQIIKALECSPLNDIGGCRKIDALDLINRQKAEIVQLKQNLEEAYIDIKEHMAEIERLRNHIMNTLDNLVRQCVEYEVKTAKSEAIKEFAEMLTDRICDAIEESSNNIDSENYFITDVYETINNLVKEMTEQKG